jgi:hypothetical protein
MILCVLLTIAGACTYDTMSGKWTASFGASGHPPTVNWDGVGEDWRDLRTNMQEMGTRLEKGWKKVTG